MKHLLIGQERGAARSWTGPNTNGGLGSTASTSSVKKPQKLRAGRSGFPELPVGRLPGFNWEQWGERCLTTAVLTLIQLLYLNFRRNEYYREANVPHAPLITATLMLMLLIILCFATRLTNNCNVIHIPCLSES